MSCKKNRHIGKLTVTIIVAIIYNKEIQLERKMDFYILLILLGVCCAILTAGFCGRSQRWGPWTMLVGISCLLILIMVMIYKLSRVV